EGVAAPSDTVANLRRAIIDYVQQHVRTNIKIPDTFAELNAQNIIGPIAPEQMLVRLECLTEPAEKTAISVNQLKVALEKGNDLNLINHFIDLWNTREDIPRTPCPFVAFKDELRDELASPDWPN